MWLYDGQSLRSHQLQSDGAYAVLSASRWFPSLDLRELERFLEKFDPLGETAWIRSFRAWVKEHYGHLAR